MADCSRSCPVCEKTEGAPEADLGGIVLQETERAAVPENTCCGVLLHAPHTAGPFLKFWGMERARSSATGSTDIAGADRAALWMGSVLVVTKAKSIEVVVKLHDPASPNTVVTLQGEELDQYGGWVALKFPLRVPVGAQEKKVRYTVTVSGQTLRPRSPTHGEDGFCFHVAGSSQPTHWGFYSCSGFTPDVPVDEQARKWNGITPLWKDVLAVHMKKPLHVLVGGGDQLYCDDVWSLPSLRSFLELPFETQTQREARRLAAYSTDMRAQVDAYYFHHYACHFSQQPISDVYALVPQVMAWDDHDIFDGWGSYPSYLQESVVFQGVFEAAKKWYSVFQQHCRPKELLPVAVYQVGARTAIMACDMRSKRRKDEIVPLEHYMSISLLCKQLPPDIDHVVFVSTVPVVYPHVLGARTLLKVLKNGFMKSMLGPFGARHLNQFGEPELSDDLDDHWSAPAHREERRFLVEHLQMLAKYRGCRVTLLSGDVHVCGAGRLISSPKPPDEEALRHDFRYMSQVVSSAIGNAPPPSALVTLLEYFNLGGHINKNTKHSMASIFRPKLGAGRPLINKRNWCEVVEQPVSAGGGGGGLIFRLRVEETAGAADSVKEYDIAVPPLQKVPATGEYYAGRRKSRGWVCFGA